jgi:hypothetical protein
MAMMAMMMTAMVTLTSIQLFAFRFSHSVEVPRKREKLFVGRETMMMGLTRIYARVT